MNGITFGGLILVCTVVVLGCIKRANRNLHYVIETTPAGTLVVVCECGTRFHGNRAAENYVAHLDMCAARNMTDLYGEVGE